LIGVIPGGYPTRKGNHQGLNGPSTLLVVTGKQVITVSQRPCPPCWGEEARGF